MHVRVCEGGGGVVGEGVMHVHVCMCCSKLTQNRSVFDAKTVLYLTNKLICNSRKTVPYSTLNRSLFNVKLFPKVFKMRSLQTFSHGIRRFGDVWDVMRRNERFLNVIACFADVLK